MFCLKKVPIQICSTGLSLFIVSILLSSCNSVKNAIDPYNHISDQKVVATLKKSFATLGGLEKWQNKKELHYEKSTKLYLESGVIEMESYQNHDYFYGKNPSVNISWKGKDGKQQKITSINGTATKYINDEIDKTANTASLNNSVTTSLFVIGVPFKMLDKGVTLSHEGIDVLEDGQKVEVIKAIYNPDTFVHHTTPDIWWYYFDAMDAKLMAYMVKHADHYSYVKNLDFTTDDGFIFPKTRASYRVSPEREILYLRADYEYKNWDIKW